LRARGGFKTHDALVIREAASAFEESRRTPASKALANFSKVSSTDAVTIIDVPVRTIGCSALSIELPWGEPASEEGEK